MKMLAEAAAKAVKESTEQMGPTVTAVRTEPRVLRRIWERMTDFYNHAWVSAYGPAPQTNDGELSNAGDTWSRVLAGLTYRQIATGLKACSLEGKEFPPSLPRFRAMCLKVPSLAIVRSQLHHKQPSAFAHAVWLELDVFRYRQTGTDQAERQLRDAYEVVLDRVMQGEVLPDPPTAAIEHKPFPVTRATPEQRQLHYANIRKYLS